MLMLDEGLAKVTTELDLKDIRLTVRRKGQKAGRLQSQRSAAGLAATSPAHAIGAV